MRYILAGAMLLAILVALFGCGPGSEEMVTTGYADGYNITIADCHDVDRPEIVGRWSNDYYMKGYVDGGAAAAAYCDLEKEFRHNVGSDRRFIEGEGGPGSISD